MAHHALETQSPDPAVARPEPESRFPDASLRLPEQIAVEHGPTDLVSSVLLLGDRLAHERGVRLYLNHGLASLKDLHRREAWIQESRPLPAQFDVDCCKLTSANSFWIEGRDAEGKLAVTQAARFYDWSKTDLKREAESLRMFYDKPKQWGRPGKDMVHTQPMPLRITGRVVYSGALWVRPDMRGRGFAKILPRLSRMYGYTQWNSDFTITQVVDALLDKGMGETYGYNNRIPGHVFRNRYGGTYPCSWVYMRPEELLDDARRFVEASQATRPRTTVYPETMVPPSAVRQGRMSLS